MGTSARASDRGDEAASAAALAAEIRRRLGPPRGPERWPTVSIVVPNRNGAADMRRLVAGLAERTDYPGFELIIVDNASSDDSLDFIRRVEAPFPISIVANSHNESFSDACNAGAGAADGELLLFLNNDVEPLEPGWLRELVACRDTTGAGLAAATLLRPSPDREWGYRVQHRAIRLREEDGVLAPDRRGYGDDPFSEGFGVDLDSPAPAGACMLMERELFDQIGGFTHGYLYGAEDIDLGMKVLATDRRVVCSGRTLLVHRLGSTQTKESAARRIERAEGNRRLFWQIWGPRVRREYELDRLMGGGTWAVAGQPPGEAHEHERALALSFCLKSSEPAPPPRDDPLIPLGEELARRGHRCAILRGEEAESLTGLEFDVVVHLRGPARYMPVPGRVNVLWIASHHDAVTGTEAGHYDLVLRDGLDADKLIDAACIRFEQLDLPLRIVPQACDTTPSTNRKPL
jgi:GT2 family glycosyltransferase